MASSPFTPKKSSNQPDLSPLEMHWVDALIEALFSLGQPKRFLDRKAYADLARFGLGRRRVDLAIVAAARLKRITARMAGGLTILELVEEQAPPAAPAEPQRAPRQLRHPENRRDWRRR
jgi:hypothetical protein